MTSGALSGTDRHHGSRPWQGTHAPNHHDHRKVTTMPVTTERRRRVITPGWRIEWREVRLANTPSKHTCRRTAHWSKWSDAIRYANHVATHSVDRPRVYYVGPDRPVRTPAA